MAYDGLRSEVVLFGGWNGSYLGDTWTWDGTTWTEQQPPTSPAARNGMVTAFDAARGEVVGFGGHDGTVAYGDTWTWDGTTWRVPFTAHLRLSPNSGLPGTPVQVKATGFAAFEQVTITFIDSVNGETVLGTFTSDASGDLAAQVTIPENATVGAQKVTAVGATSSQKAQAKFTVT
jgi:hypothetical protein